MNSVPVDTTQTFEIYQNLVDVWTWFNHSGITNLATMFGFLLSAYIALKVYKVNRYIFLYRRLPSYISSLKSYSSSIIELINNYDDSVDEIIDELVKCETDLKTIKKKLPRHLRPELSKLSRVIKKNSKPESITKQSARDIYRTILSVSQGLLNFQKDYQLEK